MATAMLGGASRETNVHRVTATITTPVKKMRPPPPTPKAAASNAVSKLKCEGTPRHCCIETQMTSPEFASPRVPASSQPGSARFGRKVMIQATDTHVRPNDSPKRMGLAPRDAALPRAPGDKKHGEVKHRAGHQQATDHIQELLIAFGVSPVATQRRYDRSAKPCPIIHALLLQRAALGASPQLRTGPLRIVEPSRRPKRSSRTFPETDTSPTPDSPRTCLRSPATSVTIALAISKRRRTNSSSR